MKGWVGFRMCGLSAAGLPWAGLPSGRASRK